MKVVKWLDDHLEEILPGNSSDSHFLCQPVTGNYP